MDDGRVLERRGGKAGGRRAGTDRLRLLAVLVCHCACLLAPTIVGAQGADLYVKADARGSSNGTGWDDAFTELQDALDLAFPGDEIWVAAGTYRPSIRTLPEDPRSATFQLLNDVVLYGGFAGTETRRDERDPAASETILSGDLAGNDGPEFQNNGENAYSVVTGSHTDETAILDGFTITAARGGAAVMIESGSPTISNCRVVRNSSGGAAGVAVISHSRPVLTNCTIDANVGGLNGGQGMRVDFEGAHATLVGCVLSRNTIGIGVANFASVSLTECVIEKNDHDGIVVGFRSEALLTNCTIAHNLDSNPPGPWENHGMTLSSSSSATLTNCVVWGNGRGAILRDASAAAEVTYSCIEGERLWPGEGNINADPLFCSAASEVLVSDQSGLEAALEFDSLMLSPDSPCLGAGQGAANMGAETGICEGDQGGRIIRLAPGRYSMESLNLGQGVSLIGTRGDRGEAAVLEGTVFGLRTGALLSNVTVTGAETLGGIVVDGGESPVIRECRIVRNSASVGGGVRCDSGSSPTLINCTITGNSATFGGGVYASGAAPVLINCTITRNSARSGGGLRGRKQSAIELSNCIVWDNDGGSIDLSDSRGQEATLQASFSLIDDDEPWPGSGNINADPLFVADGDSRLQPESPAIDAGTRERAPANDIDGNERPCGSGVDMGSREYCEGRPPASPRFVRGDCNGDGEVAGQVGDAVFLLHHNFAGGAAPPCAVACDANGDGEIGSVGDAVYLLNFNFAGGPPPSAPYPDCGPRALASDEALECERAAEACQ